MTSSGEAASYTETTHTETAVVRTDDLHVHIGGRAALCGVDLEVRRGDVLAVIGPNGSGKSTLVKAIVGLYRASSGSVSLTSPKTGKRLPRAQIGYVPQRVTINGSLPASVSEVVGSGVHSGVFRRTASAAKGSIAAALRMVELEDLAHRPVTALSGGQQQRVLIARALIRDPELLILDEPLAGVDLSQQEAFATILSRLRDEGRTIVLVLHEFGPLSPVITRVVGLQAGRVEYSASPEDAPDHCDDQTGRAPAGWLPDTPHDHVHPHEDAAPHEAPWTTSQVPIDTTPRQ